MKPSLLKGADLKQYHWLVQAAEQCDFDLHFGQVSRHLCQDAHDGHYGYDRYDRDEHDIETGDLEIGETYEDQIVIDGGLAWLFRSLFRRFRKGSKPTLVTDV